MVVNNAVARREPIYRGIDVSWEDFAGFAKSWAEKILGECVAANKPINPLAGVVGVELDDAAEVAGAQFVLQDLDFGLEGSPPELAVEIAAPARAARVVLEASRIANRI